VADRRASSAHPDNFIMEYVRKQVEEKRRKPLDICCKQEIEWMQIVLKSLRITLSDMRLAIDGSIVMNDGLYNAMNSLFDGHIPAHWLSISWPADSLKAWFDEAGKFTLLFSRPALNFHFQSDSS
jgi:dynein heavy chain